LNSSAGNRQRNNAESIEGSVSRESARFGGLLVLFRRHGSNAPLYFRERRIPKSSDHLCIPLHSPRSGFDAIGRVHSARGQYFSFLYRFLDVFSPRSIPSRGEARVVAFNASQAGRVRGITYVSLRTLGRRRQHLSLSPSSLLSRPVSLSFSPLSFRR